MGAFYYPLPLGQPVGVYHGRNRYDTLVDGSEQITTVNYPCDGQIRWSATGSSGYSNDPPSQRLAAGGCRAEATRDYDYVPTGDVNPDTGFPVYASYLGVKADGIRYEMPDFNHSLVPDYANLAPRIMCPYSYDYQGEPSNPTPPVALYGHPAGYVDGFQLGGETVVYPDPPSGRAGLYFPPTYPQWHLIGSFIPFETGDTMAYAGALGYFSIPNWNLFKTFEQLTIRCPSPQSGGYYSLARINVFDNAELQVFTSDIPVDPSTVAPTTRKFPRDVGGFASASRIYPPARSGRIAGGQL